MSDRKIDISDAWARAKAIAAKVQRKTTGAQDKPHQQPELSQPSGEQTRRPDNEERGMRPPNRLRSPPPSAERREMGYQRPIAPARERNVPEFPLHDQEFMYVDGNVVGLIIGRGGDTLRSLEHESRTSIRVIQEMLPDGKKKVMITGRPDDVRIAKKLIQDRISEIENRDSGSGGNGGKEEIRVPQSKVGLIIGRQASTLKDMQAKSGARIWVIQDQQPNETDHRIIHLIGTQEAIDKAKQLIEELINPVQRDDQQQGQGQGHEQHQYRQSSRCVEKFEISCEAAGIVIGRGGECIRSMSQHSGCHLKVDSAPHGQPRTVIVVGETQEIVDNAKQMILDTISNGVFQSFEAFVYFRIFLLIIVI